MPTVLNKEGVRYFFYSLEGAEPPHIHIEQAGATAKFWLEPVELASSRGFRSHSLRRLRLNVIENRERFLEAWHGHFGDQDE